MSQESRIVRPFNVDPELERIFETTRLRFGDLECESGSRIMVEDSSTYTLRKAELIWAGEHQNFMAFKRELANGAARSGLDHKLLSIVVTAYTVYLKMTDVIYNQPLTDLDALPQVVELTGHQTPRALQASSSGAEVNVYLVLTEELLEKPLCPWRKGTWLTRTRFRIRTTQELTLFRPIPLTDEIRRELHLPAKTTRYLHMGDYIPTEPDGDSVEPVFYVDEDLLSELAARANSPVGIMLQSQLVVDFVTAVVAASVSDHGPTRSTYEEIRGSLLGRVINFVAPQAQEFERNKLLEMVHDEPARFVAHLEDVVDVRKTMLESLRDEQR